MVEILQVALDEVKGVSPAASQLISNTQKITVFCNTCSCNTCSSVSEENLHILTLPVSMQNKCLCPLSSVLSESNMETCIINSAPILIIQLYWFSNQGGELIKDANFFSCTQSESNKHVMVPIIVEDELYFTNKYSLIATINHSDTLNMGHYWATTKNLHSSSWYSCHENLVFNVAEYSLNNATSYILFYSKV